MPLTIQTLVLELRNRRNRAKEDLEESRKFDHFTPGFNQDLGAYDALEDLLKWIEDQRKAL